MNDKLVIQNETIQNRIFTIRGLQVIIDRDLAEMYQVETKVLNQAVKRNIKRFPDIFRFQLTENELNNLRSQFVTSSEHGGRRYLPYAFTEQGVAMLSAVLRSDIAIKVSIQIMQAFVQLRHLIYENAVILQRLDKVEQKQIETDAKFDQLFDALESKTLKPKQGIFYDGQIFDAYVFVNKIVKTAQNSLFLIDNFIDETVLTLLSKRNKNCKAIIYTKNISRQLKLDLAKHNAQYPKIGVKIYKNAHDRFLILDNKEVYHIGASLKDLGKKWFAFSKINIDANDLINKLEKR